MAKSSPMLVETNGAAGILSEDVEQIMATASERDELHEVGAASENGIEKSSIMLMDLCDEMLVKIICDVDCPTVCNLAKTCRRLEQLVLERQIWTKFDFSTEKLSARELMERTKYLNAGTRSFKVRGLTSNHPFNKWDNVTITKKMLATLIDRCPKLDTLSVSEGFINLNETNIKHFPSTLRRLEFHRCEVPRPKVPAMFFQKIDLHMKHLEELSLRENYWFETHDLVLFSKLPVLRRLDLSHCSSMAHCVPYASIACRYGFKVLQVLDLRNTPISDSDLQCFNITETLRELLLECPAKLRDQVRPVNLSQRNRAPMRIAFPATNRPRAVTTDAGEGTSAGFVCTRPTMAAGTDSDAAGGESSATTAGHDDEGSTSDDVGQRMQLNGGAASQIGTAAVAEPSAAAIPNQNAGPSAAQNEIAGSPRNQNNNNIRIIIRRPTENAAEGPERPQVNLITLDNWPPQHRVHAELQQHLDQRARAGNQIALDRNNGTLGPPIIIMAGPNPALHRMRTLPYKKRLLRKGGRPGNKGASKRAKRDEENSREGDDEHETDDNNERSGGSDKDDDSDDDEDDLHVDHGESSGDSDEDEDNFDNRLNEYSAPIPSNVISDRGVCSFGVSSNAIPWIWIRSQPRKSKTVLERLLVRHYVLVTDITLQHFIECAPQMRYLDVTGTSVTAAGVDNFRKVRADCTIVSDFGTHAGIL